MIAFSVTLKKLALVVYLTFAFLHVADGISYPGDDQKPSLEDAIRTVENENAEMRLRVDAVQLLARKNAKEHIPRLGNVLQGRYDTLAHNVLSAFQAFESNSALPYMIEYERRAVDEGVIIPGKINAALKSAKRACEKKLK